MPEYRRFVAYVYDYPNGEKENGRGFIKVEVRDGICRMQAQLAGIYGASSMPCRIFGFVRENGESRAVPLGRCDMAGNQVRFQLEMPENSMGGSSYSLNDLSGMVFLMEDGNVYGTVWDDQMLRPGDIIFEDNREEENRRSEEREMIEEPEKEAMEPTKEEAVMLMPEKEVIMPEEESIEAPKREPVMPMPEEEEVLTGRASMEAPKGEPVLMQKEEEVMPRRMSARPGNEGVMHVQGQAAAVPREDGFCPFSDDDITDCRKITPQEFRYLSRRDRGLLNNHFLRRGYYQHRHLLLGKKKMGNRCVLGVPGIYGRQECIEAAMYGFPNFKEVQQNTARPNQHFGYWYRLIDAPDMNIWNSFR